MKKNLKLTAIFAVLVSLFVLTGCPDPSTDFNDPVIGYQVVGQTLNFNASDSGVGVEIVELYVNASMVASYTSGFGSMSYDLSSYGYGTFNIKIVAKDFNGNKAEVNFVHRYEMYTEDNDITRKWMSVFTYYGEVKFELVHESTTYTPNGDAPPKPGEHKDYFYIRNYTNVNLIGWTASVAAYASNGTLLWTWNSAPGSISIPYNGWFEAPEYTLNTVVPAYYQVSFF